MLGVIILLLDCRSCSVMRGILVLRVQDRAGLRLQHILLLGICDGGGLALQRLPALKALLVLCICHALLHDGQARPA